MATKGDILAGEAPPKDHILATDEQKVTIVNVTYVVYYRIVQNFDGGKL